MGGGEPFRKCAVCSIKRSNRKNSGTFKQDVFLSRFPLDENRSSSKKKNARNTPPIIRVGQNWMAMYYYASKLNEASCSGCRSKTPSASEEAAPVNSAALDHPPLPTDSTLLHGSALSYYDNEDYYSMRGGSVFTAESACKHIVMNGGINCVTTQSKSDDRKIPPPLPVSGKLPAGDVEKSEVEYKDGQMVSVTLEALVDMLRPGVSKSFAFTFLLCSRLYIKPNELLGKLCKRYFRNYDKIGKQEARDLVDKELADMAALVKVLRLWTSSFPYDFRDDRVMALVRTITQRCAAEHMASTREEMSALLQKLLEKLTALEKYEETSLETPQVSSVDRLQQGDVLTLGLTPAELASQLTSVELHRLSFIGPEEFVQTFAPSHNNQPASSFGATTIGIHPAETKSTRNLEVYADWFNTLSYLVATDIVKAPKTKLRARIIEQWVMTARECFNLGNFNSLMAIISALNMAPITRLKKTWGRTSAVCGQQLRQLELCIEPGGNHARYRAALAAAPTETAVPLLSVTCRDLHFANQGNPSKVSGNRVNFEKCSLLARHVSAALARRRLMEEEPPLPQPPAPHATVWRYLNNKPVLTEIGMELASYDREPPADNTEKERLKRLRISA